MTDDGEGFWLPYSCIFFLITIHLGRALWKLRSTLSDSSFFGRIIFLPLLISFEGFAGTKRMITVYSSILNHLFYDRNNSTYYN
jgi:hypothetical protein